MVQEGAGEKEVLLQSHSFPSFSYFYSQWSTSIPTQCQVDFQGLLVQQVEVDQIFLPVHSFLFFLSFLFAVVDQDPKSLIELLSGGRGGVGSSSVASLPFFFLSFLFTVVDQDPKSLMKSLSGGGGREEVGSSSAAFFPFFFLSFLFAVVDQDSKSLMK